MSKSPERSGVQTTADPAVPPNIKLTFLPPVLAFLIAGLTKLVHWDVGWAGVGLLIACGAIGVCLQAIPRRAVRWHVTPCTSRATLKQTIGTMRALVAIALITSTLLVLATSRTILKMIPPMVGGQVEQMLQKRDHNILIVDVSSSPPSAKFFTGGVFTPQPAPTAIPNASVSTSTQPPAVAKVTRLELIDLSDAIEAFTRDKILSSFYIAECTMLVLAAVFVFTIFLMELLGDMLWDQEVVRARDARTA